ncbi:hypothetical protein COW46_04370 [Candidatus Gracilibacteria bacterium CG17_big_fil_post_rev_8_21_14_2_50_48_13]|nr:MAG: hypothetical protein COW46_04370 [Candidatus Gracilibacteria bacterium CG17_big_fil_post_rev_8_21_14_2_50_48_13]
MLENSPRIRAALRTLLSESGHPVNEVYRTLCRLATVHHAILLEEPAYGFGRVLAEFAAAEIFGIPETTLHRHQDFTLLPSNGRPISVETARQTLDRFGIGSAEGRRIVVWEDIDRMNTQGLNIFLKTLEEPESATLFLLTTANPESLLPTVVSRVLSVTLEEHLQKAVAREMLRNLRPEEQEGFAHVSLHRPGLLEILLEEQGNKKTPLTDILHHCSQIATDLVLGKPEGLLRAYKGILELKELETARKKSTHTDEYLWKPMELFCLIMEGTLEKALISTTIEVYPTHISRLATRLLQFKKDMQQSMNTKLSALDFIFGATA